VTLGLLALFIPSAVLSMGATLYLWRLHAHDRTEDARIPRPRVRLSLVMAATATLATAISLYFAVLLSLRLTISPGIFAHTALFTVFAIWTLSILPLIQAGYLRWLNGQRDKSL
jgi:protein-S-isoprenylcysteine O-methyltransferase Ste14